jgi:hypothetical protein
VKLRSSTPTLPVVVFSVLPPDDVEDGLVGVGVTFVAAEVVGDSPEMGSFKNTGSCRIKDRHSIDVSLSNVNNIQVHALILNKEIDCLPDRKAKAIL